MEYTSIFEQALDLLQKGYTEAYFFCMDTAVSNLYNRPFIPEFTELQSEYRQNAITQVLLNQLYNFTNRVNTHTNMCILMIPPISIPPQYMMLPQIEKALQSLQSANYAGYFEAMDTVTIPLDLITLYAEHKGKFITGSQPYNFHQQLSVFAKEVDRQLANPTKTDVNVSNQNQIKTNGNNTTIITNSQDSTINIQNGEKVKDSPKDTLKILMLTANPAGTNKLDFPKEVDAMTGEFQTNENIKFVRYHAVDFSTLQTHILDEKPDILHFSGHGIEEGIMLQNDDHHGYEIVKIEALEALFDFFELKKIRFKAVILNACHSQEQAEVIKNYVKYVIGTTKEVRDNSAIAFSKGFYKNLVRDMKDIHGSFALGKAGAIQKGAKKTDFIISENANL